MGIQSMRGCRAAGALFLMAALTACGAKQVAVPATAATAATDSEPKEALKDPFGQAPEASTTSQQGESEPAQ